VFASLFIASAPSGRVAGSEDPALPSDGPASNAAAHARAPKELLTIDATRRAMIDRLGTSASRSALPPTDLDTLYDRLFERVASPSLSLDEINAMMRSAGVAGPSP
jgi:hypothetical protein